MKSIVKNYRQSPRKVRLVADLVRGKKVEEAVATLRFITKRAAEPVKKAIESALANAKQNNKAEANSLFIKEIQVNKGVVGKRFMPRAFGRATPINRRSSHISVVLEEGTSEMVKKLVKTKKTEKVDTKKTVTKDSKESETAKA